MSGARLRVSVDENAVVLRVTRDKWSVPECAKRFGVGEKRIRGILKARGVQPASRSPELDPDAVLRTYDRVGSVVSTAAFLGADRTRIVKILDSRGVPYRDLADEACEPHLKD